MPLDTHSSLHKAAIQMAIPAHNFLLETSPNIYSSGEPADVPSKKIFKSFNNISSYPSSSPLWTPPNLAECATHLEFLEVLYDMREQVLASGSINLAMGYESKYKPDDLTIKAWHKGKWEKYVEFAVVRFLTWRETLNSNISTYEVLPYLPSLDILVVWHSLLLNPATFRKNYEREPLYKIKFPWEAIHSHINKDSWGFSYAEDDKDKFERHTGLDHDLLKTLEEWPTDPTYAPKKECIALKDFRFGKRAGEANPLNLQHNKTLALYFQKFLHAEPTLSEALRDAVLRQGKFVEKMHDLLWIRSPALEGTLQRAIGRYENFCELMRRVPSVMVVPTQDIDLVWHTHQCAAAQYVSDTQARVGRFINHDDAIRPGRLRDGFERTARLYREHFSQDYSICGCWDCELLASAMEEALSSGTDIGTVIDMDYVIEKQQKLMKWHRAVEIKRKKHEVLPSWE
ncbi:unnamed protein product [Clonostachys rosea]|uniref:Uncharacterized protein n=1 Tax=Bionectria ochroleuca TaxID=29856 RepID=A0ABY6TPN2_BIOOC|nr:unnamed protein product [Clonostachys rosea]